MFSGAGIVERIRIASPKLFNRIGMRSKLHDCAGSGTNDNDQFIAEIEFLPDVAMPV